jgi:hypothetical protein
LTGRWRYDRTAGRGIALCYDDGVSGPRMARRAGAHAGECCDGRWRYNRFAGRGIALSYERVSGSAAGAPSASSPSAHAAPPPPWPVTHSPLVRVLCSCGVVFTFEDDAAACPGCGRLAEWPTTGVVEREMRSDLEELLRRQDEA